LVKYIRRNMKSVEEPPMETMAVEIKEASSRLGDLLSLVGDGTEIILTEESRPVARIVPVDSFGRSRVPGLHRGTMCAADDFDEPLPDSL